jgi:hypothetical protein
MKSVRVLFLLLILLSSAQSAWQVSAQSADETKRQAAAVVYSPNPEANELFLKAREYYDKSNPFAYRCGTFAGVLIFLLRDIHEP